MRRTVSVLLLLALTSCATSGTRPASAPASTDAPPPADASARKRLSFQPAADRSLTSEAYVARGLPAPDRVWLGSDFQRAAELLTTLAKEDPALLPRRASPRSGVAFARLVSGGETLATPGPSDLRVQDGGTMVKAYAAILFAYARAHVATDGGFSLELREIMETMLGVEIVLLEGIRDTPVPKDGAQRERMLEGRAKVQGGMASSIGGLVQTVASPEELAVPDRLRLCERTVRDVPRVVPYLSPLGRAELPGVLDRWAAATDLPAVRSQLLELKRRVLAAPPPIWK